MNLLKKHTYLSNNLFTLLSYNKKSINVSIRLIRLKIMYLFFHIYKKINLIKIYKKYKLYKMFISLLNKINYIRDTHLLYKLTDHYFSLFNNFFFSCHNILFLNFNNSFFFYSNTSCLYYNLLFNTNKCYKTLNFSSKLKHLNYFLYLYKKYNYVLFIWFYSIKYFKFFSLNWSSIKTRQKKWVVLRSPHTNKKSKEVFKLKKIKKTMNYPSFLYSKNVFFFKNIINESILLKNRIYLFKF